MVFTPSRTGKPKQTHTPANLISASASPEGRTTPQNSTDALRHSLMTLRDEQRLNAFITDQEPDAINFLRERWPLSAKGPYPPRRDSWRNRRTRKPPIALSCASGTISPAGVKRAAVSGSGIFKDATSDALIRSTFFNGTIETWSLVIPDFGTVTGLFQIVSLEYAGEHNGEVTFEMSLESAGAISFSADV